MNKRTGIIIAAALCVCVVLAAVIAIHSGGNDPAGTQGRPAEETGEIIWTESMQPDDYFRYCTSLPSYTSAVTGTASLTFAPTVVSYPCQELTDKGIIPIVPGYEDMSFNAYSKPDGEIYRIEVRWNRQGASNENNRVLRMKAVDQEYADIDEAATQYYCKGKLVEPNPTITKRDGIAIKAVGMKDEIKTLTWERSGIRYKITGSYAVSYEYMVSVLDFFWEHPADFSQFHATSSEHVVEYLTPEEYPQVFEHVPDLAPFGKYLTNKDETTVTLVDGKFQNAELTYKNGPGASSGGMRWCIYTDYSQLPASKTVYNLGDVTYQDVVIEQEADGSIAFKWDEYYILVIIGNDLSSDELWHIIESMK